MLRIELPKQKYTYIKIYGGIFKAQNTTSDGIVHVNIQVNFSRRFNVEFY